MKYVPVCFPSLFSADPSRTRWGVGQIEEDGSVTFLMWMLDEPSREGVQRWIDNPEKLQARLDSVAADARAAHRAVHPRDSGYFSPPYGSRGGYPVSDREPKVWDYSEWSKPKPPPKPKPGLQTLGEALEDDVQRSNADDKRGEKGGGPDAKADADA